MSSSSSSRPNQTTPSAPPAPASHGWLRLYHPTVPSNVGQSVPLFPLTSCYSPATSAPTRTHTRTSQPSYSPLPATGPAHLQWLLFVPSEASPSSSALVHSPCMVFRPLALSTSSTTEMNKEMTVHGEDDSRDPPASWQYASKCLYSTSPKIWFLLIGWTSGAHAIVNIVNKRENYTTSG